MMSTEGWDNKDAVEVPVVQKLTFDLALMVLGHCAFGLPYDWASPTGLPDRSMSVQEALRIVADTNLFAIVAPKWAWKLPFKWYLILADMNTGLVLMTSNLSFPGSRTLAWRMDSSPISCRRK